MTKNFTALEIIICEKKRSKWVPNFKIPENWSIGHKWLSLGKVWFDNYFYETLNVENYLKWGIFWAKHLFIEAHIQGLSMSRASKKLGFKDEELKFLGEYIGEDLYKLQINNIEDIVQDMTKSLHF